MTLRKILAAVTAAVFLVLTGCGIPLRVERVYVGPTQAPPQVTSASLHQRGLRYRLHRPKTTVAVRIPDGKPDDIKSMGTANKTTECEPYRLDFVISQTMDGGDWIYEAEFTPNPFADTDVTLTLREDGGLAAVSAGETDQLLPFIEAVAGFTLNAAKVAARDVGAANCAIDPALRQFVEEEVRLRKTVLELVERIREREAALAKVGADYELARAALESLLPAFERAKERLAKHDFRLDAKRALIRIDGKLVFGDENSTELWFEINLTTEA